MKNPAHVRLKVQTGGAVGSDLTKRKTTMLTKIICATVATLAIGTAAQAGGFNTAGMTKTTTISHPGNFTQNTTTFTNQSGKVVTAISSISSNPAPTSTPPGTLVPKGMIISRTPS